MAVSAHPGVPGWVGLRFKIFIFDVVPDIGGNGAEVNHPSQYAHHNQGANSDYAKYDGIVGKGFVHRYAYPQQPTPSGQTEIGQDKLNNLAHGTLT